MKKVKAIFSIILIVVLFSSQTLCVWGEEKEWYILQEIEDDSLESGTELTNDLEVTPYTRYIVGASVTIKRPSSGEIWMRTEVYCSEVMSKITTVFTLQKKVGNRWINVGEGSVSSSNDNSMYKSMEATGVSSGTYRCIADTSVVSKTGYTETVSVVSGTV